MQQRVAFPKQNPHFTEMQCLIEKAIVSASIIVMPFNPVPKQSVPVSIVNLVSRSPGLLFILLYFTFQVFYLTGISNGAGVDDAEQLAYMGALQWGYGGSQPPLYTWINNLASSLFGISLFTVYLVKFSMLASTYASIYFGARLLNLPRAVATAGMLGVFLLPQIAWESQRTLTHSVGGTAGCAWAFLTFAWYMKSRSWFAATMFGVAIAAGLLGKFNAIFFMSALVAAALTIPGYRSVVLSAKSIATVLAFALCIAPTVFWAVSHTENLLARTHKFQANEGGQFFSSRVHGIWRLLSNSALFSGVALVCFGLILAIAKTEKNSAKKVYDNAELLVIRTLLIALLLVLLGVIFSGAAEVKDRWLQPILFLTPLGLSIIIGHRVADERYLRNFALAGVFCALIVIPSLAVNRLYARDGNAPSIGQLDYAELFNITRAEADYRSVVSNSPQLPGNLRLFDTSINPVHLEMPNAKLRLNRPALVVWFGTEPNSNLVQFLASTGVNLPHNVRHISLKYKYYPDVKEDVSYFIAP
ncbi:glycosyltransferase family 39 protein [Phyllobacterium sp. YR531]|uniref:ArnT family glycosyltransferase n=1 Tax=Phyllobacterium sp. YR531 TaxID=1144343 RepID=UPI0012F65980|nr:glycosyltransferase family 39 protein [Phyllobacterium sp. YR531]